MIIFIIHFNKNFVNECNKRVNRIQGLDVKVQWKYFKGKKIECEKLIKVDFADGRMEKRSNKKKSQWIFLLKVKWKKGKHN